MNGGLFVALYDEDSLKLYLNRGLYGFLMPPVLANRPSSRSRHYNVLADYACSREGSAVFFFLRRKIVYGGRIYGNETAASFFLNGKTSPLGIRADADLFWDESVRKRYIPTETPGIFRIQKDGGLKAQPFLFQFLPDEDTGKSISSDELYFELGKYPYPLPSNSMQGMGFCTLTPGEVETLFALIKSSEIKIDFQGYNEVEKSGKEQVFDSDLVSTKDEMVNEAQLEFTILSSLKPFAEFLNDEYVLCRQVPLSPFKPSDMDRADICLYSVTTPLKNGTVPNVIIELKKTKAKKEAYNQVVRYLRWIENITTPDEFKEVKAYIIAPEIGRIKKAKVDIKYSDKIQMYALGNSEFVSLVD